MKLSRTLVGMALVGVVFLFGVSTAHAGSVFQGSYDPSMTFQDQLGATTMSLTFDGTHYWSASGGSSGGQLAQYDATGGWVQTFSPGLDFRSLFVDFPGNVYARAKQDAKLCRMTSPGVFTPTGVSLAGAGKGSPFDNSKVVSMARGGTYIGQSVVNTPPYGGTVQVWGGDGQSLGTVPLVAGPGGGAYGAEPGEGNLPQFYAIAAANERWLTYSEGLLSVWDSKTGQRLDTTLLNGAGTGAESHWSLSYANSMVWVVDQAGGLWRGYNVGLGAGIVPEPITALAAVMGLAGLAGYIRRRRAIA